MTRAVSAPQIELATDFLISTAGMEAPALADEEFRNAFRGGNFDLAEYWRAVRDRTNMRRAEVLSRHVSKNTKTISFSSILPKRNTARG